MTDGLLKVGGGVSGWIKVVDDALSLAELCIPYLSEPRHTELIMANSR